MVKAIFFLFLLLVIVFIIDLFIIDPLPLVDEVVLGILVFLTGKKAL